MGPATARPNGLGPITEIKWFNDQRANWRPRKFSIGLDPQNTHRRSHARSAKVQGRKAHWAAWRAPNLKNRPHHPKKDLHPPVWSTGIPEFEIRCPWIWPHRKRTKYIRERRQAVRKMKRKPGAQNPAINQVRSGRENLPPAHSSHSASKQPKPRSPSLPLNAPRTRKNPAPQSAASP